LNVPLSPIYSAYFFCLLWWFAVFDYQVWLQQPCAGEAGLPLIDRLVFAFPRHIFVLSCRVFPRFSSLDVRRLFFSFFPFAPVSHGVVSCMRGSDRKLKSILAGCRFYFSAISFWFPLQLEV